MSDWVKRPYVAETDEDFVLHSWVTSYMHSRHGRSVGANVHGSAAERDYWTQHRPIVLGLMGQSDIEVVCHQGRAEPTEAGAPIFYGFWAHSGETIHYVFIKRTVYELGLGPDITELMLGDRLRRPQAYTMELVELAKLRATVRVPQWYPDFTYLIRRDGLATAKKAA